MLELFEINFYRIVLLAIGMCWNGGFGNACFIDVYNPKSAHTISIKFISSDWYLEALFSSFHIIKDLCIPNLLAADFMLPVDLCQLLRSQLLPGEFLHELCCSRFKTKANL